MLGDLGAEKNEPNVYYSLVPIKSWQYMEKFWA